MNSTVEAIVVVVTGIIGVAIVALLISNSSNTVGVIQAFSDAFSNALGVAEAPVTGASYTPNLSLSSGSGSTSSLFGSSF